MKKRGFWKDALILFAITLVAAAALSCVYSLTKEPIKTAEEETKKAAYEKVFAGVSFESFQGADALLSDVNDALHSGEIKYDGISLEKATVSEILLATDKNGNAVGFVLSVSSKGGYGGEIQAAVGVKTGGELTGLTVVSHSETAGIGAKYADKEYTSADKVDVVSGATYTTTALKEIYGAALYAADTAESGVSADA